jgi:phospholipid/cholesterol/gamma-HCH transport system ATP-binding protein
MIQIENIHKAFDGNQVLKGVVLEIKKGEIVALIGGSGCGKSVLIKTVAGLLKPDEGRVLIEGKNVCTVKGRALTTLRDRMGFLFQGGALFDSMTLYENMAFRLKEKTRLADEEIRQKVMEELNHVGLSGAEDKYPSQLSGGMTKRAALGRAMVNEPEIMLFDEPTTGLDPVLSSAMLGLIDSSHKRLSFTGVIVTHEIPKIFDIVDRVVLLQDGVIYAAEEPQEILASTDPLVEEFIHGKIERAISG